ncbi:hypothetical protein T4E_11010 [Trichinella pseudospiralis]|uniref:Uncharacterized protein n=1 Tax=Trichinella pseudospiralis TaxID=6337 RepID=A0A0V0YDN7_TRIPS|nr:hypothetical protein T4E_11010 [Trichinella pseudospiralis]
MAKKEVSVPVVRKEIKKENLPKSGLKILTKFRQEDANGLKKVNCIIPAVKDIITTKQNCKVTTENVLDRLKQQVIHEEKIHLLLEKKIIEHCQCKHDHQEQELFKIEIIEKLGDCLSLIESVLQTLDQEYCKDAGSSVVTVLPRLLENFENLLRHHKIADLLTSHENVDKVLKKDVDELNEKIEIQEKNNAELRSVVQILMKGVLEFGDALKKFNSNQKTEEETTSEINECTLDDGNLIAKLKKLDSINSELIEIVKLTENAVKIAMMFHGDNENFIFDHQTQVKEENISLDQALNNLCTVTCKFFSYGANQIKKMEKTKKHEIEQLDLIKEKIKKHLAKKEKVLQNSNSIVNKYNARKHELQMQIDQLQNEDNQLITLIIKNPEGIFSNIYENNYILKSNKQADPSLMVLLQQFVKNKSNMAVIFRKFITNELCHASFTHLYFEEKIKEAELLFNQLCYSANMLYAESIQLDEDMANVEEGIKQSKSKLEELQNRGDYYEEDVQKEKSLKSQLLLAKEAHKIVDTEIELVNSELCNLQCAHQVQLERLKYKEKLLKKLDCDFLTMQNFNKVEGFPKELCEAYRREEHHPELYREIDTLFDEFRSAASKNLKVKKIKYIIQKKLDKLKYELKKVCEENRKKKMEILHLECYYKIKQTADIDEKDLSNLSMDHHASSSQSKKLSLPCIFEEDDVHANDEMRTLESEEKKTTGISMNFSGTEYEILSLLNEMEECNKSFQKLAESEEELAHHVSNDFISITEEIVNGSSFYEDIKLEAEKRFQNEKTEKSISETDNSSAQEESTAQSFSEKSYPSKTGKHESDSEDSRNNEESNKCKHALQAINLLKTNAFTYKCCGDSCVTMPEIAVQQREPVVSHHHMKGPNPSFFGITTLSYFILQQRNSFYNAL